MSILQKLFTALRGHATEAGQAVVDANGLTIFRQELIDSRKALSSSKSSLTEIMAKEAAAKREADRLNAEVEKYTKHAKAALDKGDEGLALEVAGKIGDITTQAKRQSALSEQYGKSVKSLKGTIRATQRKIEGLEVRLQTAEATDKVQKAQSAVVSSAAGSNSSLNSALESLERIENAQQEFSDRAVAAEELASEEGTGSLDKRLEEAGIVDSDSSAADILAKIKG